MGVPAIPAYTRKTAQVGCERPFGPPLVVGDAPLGFRNLSLQAGNGSLLRLAGGTGEPANSELGDFQSFQYATVLLELNPVPGDVAIAVSDHVTPAIRMMDEVVDLILLQGWDGLVNDGLMAPGPQAMTRREPVFRTDWPAHEIPSPARS